MVTEVIDILRNVTVLMVVLSIVVYWYYYCKFQEWSKAIGRIVTLVLVEPRDNIVQIQRPAKDGKFILEVFFSIRVNAGYWVRFESSTNYNKMNRLVIAYWISYYLRRKLGVSAYPLIIDFIYYCYPLDTSDGYSQVLHEKIHRHNWNE